MKSLAVYDSSKLDIVEISTPEYNDYQALVKIISCGVCNGTDMKLIHGKFKGFDAYPALLGHEGVGEVIEKGSKVKSFNLGDYVLLPFVEGTIDGYHSGWGAFSEYGVVGDWRAMVEDGKGPGTSGFSEEYYAQQVIPRDFDPVSSAMIITFREVLSAIKRFGFKENESLVIFGAGPVGLSFTRFAKILGIGPVIVFDVLDEKVKEAAKMGADYAFNSTVVDVTQEVRRICKDGADYVLDAVGVNSLINHAMELVKYNGKICTYGISPKLNMELDWSKAPYNWTLQFLQWPSKLEESLAHNQIINWIKMGVLNPYDFISDVVDFDNIVQAFKMIEERKAKKKVVIRF